MDYEVKRVDASQIPALKELTRQVWGTVAPTSATLEAKFQTKSFGAEYIGYVAYPVGAEPKVGGYAVPAAYYGVFPVVANFGGSKVLCAQSGDTMTHPEHRGKGLFIDLARKTYATACDEGIQFVFGFPSESSYPGFSRKLDWTFPYKMVRFNCLVPTLPVGLLRRKMMRPSLRFGTFGRLVVRRLFDVVRPEGDLWTTFRDATPGILRDSRYFTYKATDTFFVQSGKTGLVLKYDGDICIGDIFGSPSAEDMTRIMRRLKLLAAVTGAMRIKSYFSPNSKLERLLEAHGSCSASLPYGFVNFSSKQDPSLLELAFLDYDTF